MKLDKIVFYINKLIGDGLYGFEDIIMDADSIIDEINLKCGKDFRLFSDIGHEEEEYKEFEDGYIRNVLCYGVAAKLLEQEDEYESQQRSYNSHSMVWLDRMAEDYREYIELGDPESEWDYNYGHPDLIRVYTNAFGSLVGVYYKRDEKGNFVYDEDGNKETVERDWGM